MQILFAAGTVLLAYVLLQPHVATLQQVVALLP